MLHVALSSGPLPGVPKIIAHGVKFDATLGLSSLTWVYIGKTLEISMYLAIRPRLTKFCM